MWHHSVTPRIAASDYGALVRIGILVLVIIGSITAVLSASIKKARENARRAGAISEARRLADAGQTREALAICIRVLEGPASVGEAKFGTAKIRGSDISFTGVSGDLVLKSTRRLLTDQLEALYAMAHIWESNGDAHGAQVISEILGLLDEQRDIVNDDRLTSWVTGKRNQDLVDRFATLEDRKQALRTHLADAWSTRIG
jgi:hypothetical protein